MLDRAVAMAETIPDDRMRGEALADIAMRLVAADPGNPAMVDGAIAVAKTMPDG